MPDSEHLAQTVVGAHRIGFACDSGAYFLETNGGGAEAMPGAVDRTIGAYRANAAAAQHSRTVAVAMYGEHRPFGYAYGGSGGGFRTIGGAENTTGVWDGFVPYVIGSPMAIPNCFTIRMHAQRLLRDRLDQIVDAVEPGGTGDPYAGLDVDEAEALREVTAMGFPPRSWFAHRSMGMHAFPVLYGGMRMADPAYFVDYWEQPGYLGHEAPASLMRDVVVHDCEVVAVIGEGENPADDARGSVNTAWRREADSLRKPVGVQLSTAPAGAVAGAELVAASGDAAGERLVILEIDGDVAVLGPGSAAAARLRPGDRVQVDNRGFLAAQTYHRHQVPSADFTVWDQFRGTDGEPAFPQRPMLIGPLFAANASGTVQSGRFEGRMIVVACLLDREAFPWQADWYRRRVEDACAEDGRGDASDRFRLWFVDNAEHGDDVVQGDPTHTVSYVGALQQALRDVSAWVERDLPPLPTTGYEVVDGQVIVPPTATQRLGLQPVVTLTVDCVDRADVRVGVADRADVRVGDDVVLVATASAPPGAGRIISVEWDLDGAGTYPIREAVSATEVTVERRWSVPVPGTHFPTVRVTAHRDGDGTTPFALVQNLARARVVAN